MRTLYALRSRFQVQRTLEHILHNADEGSVERLALVMIGLWVGFIAMSIYLAM